MRKFDFENLDREIFEGIQSLLWVLPNNHTQIQLYEKSWFNIAQSIGVKHIVKLSVMRAVEDDIFHHREPELNIEHSGGYNRMKDNEKLFRLNA